MQWRGWQTSFEQDERAGIILALSSGNSRNLAVNFVLYRQGVKDFSGHILLGTGDPEDATLEKIKEMGKVQISLVEDNDLSGANTGTEFTGAFAVIFSCGINDGETGQKTVEVEPEMALGGNLAPPVFCPVHAGGNQLNSGGINHMNDTPETPGDSLAPVAASKTGLEGLQMAEHRPENSFRETGRTFLVGVGEVVATGRGRAT